MTYHYNYNKIRSIHLNSLGFYLPTYLVTYHFNYDGIRRKNLHVSILFLKHVPRTSAFGFDRFLIGSTNSLLGKYFSQNFWRNRGKSFWGNFFYRSQANAMFLFVLFVLCFYLSLCPLCQSVYLVFEWAIPGPFLLIFVFSSKHYDFHNKYMWKGPSSNRCWDSNPRLFSTWVSSQNHWTRAPALSVYLVVLVSCI